MKRNDYIIISVICFFLGIFLISQFYSSKEYEKVIQPENNSVLTLEVAKLTKSNADLRNEVQNLTSSLDQYQNSTISRQQAYDQFINDANRLDGINGIKQQMGQGIIIKVRGNLSTPRIVDLVNAIKNIGASTIAINDERVVLHTDLSKFSGMTYYEIKVLGNSKLLKTSVERKGGIIEQVSSKDISFNVEENGSIVIAAGDATNFKYSKIIK